MKLTTALLAVGLMAGGLWAQNPNVIQSVQNNMNAVQQQKTNDSNAALGIKSSSASSQATKPAAGAPARAANPAPVAAKNTPAVPVKAQTVPANKTAVAAPKPVVGNKQSAPKPVAVKEVAGKTTAKPVEKVSAKTTGNANVAVKPAVAVGAKTIVKPAEKISAKTTVKPAEKVSIAVGVNAAVKPPVKVSPVASTTHAEKISVAASTKAPAKPSEKKNEKTVISAAPSPAAVTPAAAAPVDSIKVAEAPKPPKPEEKKWAMNGKRDPFFSPVVQQPTGSGCSTGKKCLEIGQINLHGVVKSDSGFIAVVTNNLGKAYFLRENDPVFNGYVVRITGDTVVFQETYTDQLGKPLTREVVKRLTTPAV
jgi:Tfp pilus assembly protein PilP